MPMSIFFQPNEWKNSLPNQGRTNCTIPVGKRTYKIVTNELVTPQKLR